MVGTFRGVDLTAIQFVWLPALTCVLSPGERSYQPRFRFICQTVRPIPSQVLPRRDCFRSADCPQSAARGRTDARTIGCWDDFNAALAGYVLRVGTTRAPGGGQRQRLWRVREVVLTNICFDARPHLCPLPRERSYHRRR